MTKLKPCPFCGNTNIIAFGCKEWEEDYVEECEEYVTVICNPEEGGCGASSGYHETEEEAIEAWNNRVNEMIKLNPCPLCGGKAILDRDEIYCEDCDLTLKIQLYVTGSVSISGFPTYDEAKKNMIELWNRRVGKEND